MAGRYAHLIVLFGAFLINIPICLGMIYGNLATYVYSYYYCQPQTDFHPIIDQAWMNGLGETVSAFGVLGIRVTRYRLGLRLTAALAISLCISGPALTYFTVQHSLWATAGTYVAVAGFGNGLAVATTVLLVSGWFETSVGFACGLVMCSSGLGGFALNHIITAYINPGNIAPDARHGQISYFSQLQILERTPRVFVIIGMITAALQIPGFCMLKEAPPSVSENPMEIEPQPRGENGIIEKENSNRYTENSTEGDVVPRCRDTLSSDKTPKQILKMEIFYNAWLSLFAQALGLLISSTYFKLFAQLWIEDDEFLAITGGVACLTTAAFRIICGSLIDKCGLKNALILHLASTAIILCLWYFTAVIDKWWYIIWTNILVSLCGTQFVLYPVLNIKLFGSKSFATNLFLIQTARVIVMLALPPLLTLALNQLGWFGLFSIGALINFASLLLVVIRMQTSI